MKGKKVFEGGGRTKIKEEKEEHHKKNSGRSDKAKKMFFWLDFFLHFSGSWAALVLLRLAPGCSKGSKDTFSGNRRCLKRGFLIGLAS
jgi:hypothetical protein